ncbi:MAG: hypothetical protein GY804_05070 [Alphaproteobacteria bacterium]|nr:hypothetical protein [Alphaproteobacteria bacterium]
MRNNNGTRKAGDYALLRFTGANLLVDGHVDGGLSVMVSSGGIKAKTVGEGTIVRASIGGAVIGSDCFKFDGITSISSLFSRGVEKIPADDYMQGKPKLKNGIEISNNVGKHAMLITRDAPIFIKGEVGRGAFLKIQNNKRRKDLRIHVAGRVRRKCHFDAGAGQVVLNQMPDWGCKFKCRTLIIAGKERQIDSWGNVFDEDRLRLELKMLNHARSR